MRQSTLHIDIESFSEINLPDVGLYRYAEHDSTEVLCMCWSLNDGPVSLWIPFWPDPVFEAYVHARIHLDTHWGPECPPAISAAAAEEGILFAAHNAEFERVMLNGKPGAQIGFPPTRIEKWVCTAAKAAAHSLPRALDKVGRALGLSAKKDTEGRAVMMQLCKPRNPSKNNPDPRYTTDTAPDKFVTLYNYCADDVRAERALDKRVPDLPPLERQIYHLDQYINQRGVRVDRESVQRIQWAVEELRVRLVKECYRITGLKPSQTAKITAWVRARGYPIENLQAETVDAVLDDLNPSDLLHKDVYTVLHARRSTQMKAVAKFEAILRSVCKDLRVHGMFLYHGAATGRWSSLIVQLQNLFRGIADVDPLEAIAAVWAGGLDAVIARWPLVDPMTVFSCCVRAMLIAGPGKQLMCNDYSSIEARITAWIGDQDDILDVFKDHGLIYEYTAAKMKGLNYLDVNGVLRKMKDEHPVLRQSGKTATLAFGFGGGAASYIRGAAQGGVVVDVMDAEMAKIEWRSANPEIVRTWYEIDEKMMAAVQFPGAVFAIRNKKLAFKRVGDFLYMRLPSGRKLAFYKPMVLDGELTYLGIDTYTRKWGRVRTYGARMFQNAVQGTAADVLRRGALAVSKAGYDLIGTVHDELITERDEGTGSLEEMSQLMCEINQPWIEGLPLNAAGFIAKRFKKD